MQKLFSNQKGTALISIVITLPFLIVIAYNYTSLSVNNFIVAGKDQAHTHAQVSADAAVDYAVQQINSNASWTGTSSDVTLQNANGVKTAFSVTVSNVGSDKKVITATGKAFKPASSATPASSVNLSVSLRPVRSGEYSIVSGVGGLTLRNSSKILNGSVYVNGNLTMNNTSQIGLSFLPVDVKAAHQSCPVPANATYPRICNNGENGQPITLSTQARIYGEVQANNQTNGARMSNPGLVASSGVPAVPLPDYDRTAQKNTVSSTQSGSSAGCWLGFKTWPANLKINGDVTISGPCIVTVEGNVWITGDLRLQNLGQLVVRSGLSTPPVVMVDGQDGVIVRNSSAMNPNLNGTGFRVITYASTASCSPDCSNVTGTDLFNSSNLITIDIDNGFSGANTEFYARWSKITAGNSGSVGALVGQSIDMKNSLAVTFGTSVTGFGDTLWVVDTYRRDFE